VHSIFISITIINRLVAAGIDSGPLAQSVERIHGREKSGGYSPRSVTSRNSRLCRSMLIVACGSSSSE
jgi:hypothetical protein